MPLHIGFDWDGTVAQKELGDEAVLGMCKVLGLSFTLDQIQIMQKTHAHYPLLTEAVREDTGITDDRVLTQCMVDLFESQYLVLLSVYREKTIYPGMQEVVRELASEGHRLTIVSGQVHTALAKALEFTGMKNCFTHVFGLPHDLRYTKNQVAQYAVEKTGKLDIMIGDREDDILAGKAVGAKTIWVPWGHGKLTNGIWPDHNPETPQGLLEIIRHEHS